MMEIGVKIAIYFVPFLFALCFHELAHGLVAKWRGDRTAEQMGRLTMNPLAHMDFIGTLVLPLTALLFNSPIFFGWAKPVPVNERNLKNARTDMFWIALAGPMSNVLLAVVAAGIMLFARNYMITTSYYNGVITLLDVFIGINLFLAVFNILPLHPLDGGKVLARFLPEDLNQKLEENQHITSMVLLVLLVSGQLKVLAIPVLYGRDFLRALAGF